MLRSPCKLIVLTGGPGAGKTAVMEAARQVFSPQRVAILPESASIVYSGGFPRMPTVSAVRAAQRAIFHVQRELEDFFRNDEFLGLVLCDRGIVDGAAYWPGSREDFFAAVGATRAEIFSRYSAVIHLETPDQSCGYSNSSNPNRIESAAEAKLLDEKIYRAWEGHPKRFMVSATKHFPEKLAQVIALIQSIEGETQFVEPVFSALELN